MNGNQDQLFSSPADARTWLRERGYTTRFVGALDAPTCWVRTDKPGEMLAVAKDKDGCATLVPYPQKFLTEAQRLLRETSTKEIIDMATKNATSKKTTKTAAKKAVAAVKPKEPKQRKETAGGMFQELILAGGLTDDQIFAKVKAKFGLDDGKRSYVAWYRNSLQKKGKNPPAAKEE